MYTTSAGNPCPGIRDWKVHMDIDKNGIHLFTLLANVADVHPNKIFFSFNDREYSYGQVMSAAQSCAHAFARLGVNKGQRVVLQCGNNPYFIFAFFGIMQLGATAILVNPAARVHEMSYYYTTGQASMIITDGSLATQFSKQVEKFPGATFITLSPAPGFESIESILSGERELNIWNETRLDDPAVIIFTSAMDGYALGATLSHNNLTRSAAITSSLFKDNGGRFVAILPFFHAFGLTTSLIMPLLNTREIILIPRFSPKKLIQVLARPDTGFITAVPAIYRILKNLLSPGTDYSHITVWVSGGDFLPVSLQQWFQDTCGIIIRQGYGLTEASPIVTWNIPDRDPRPGSIGRAMPYNSVKIVHNGLDCEPGKEGELLVKGLNVTRGYYNNPGKTSQFIKDDWLHTGDIGCMDSDGYFFLTGRKKNMILKNGFNVYPAEVERILSLSPGIESVRVSGHYEISGDASSVESLHATVISSGNSRITEEEIRKWCIENISSYKIPDTLEISH